MAPKGRGKAIITAGQAKGKKFGNYPVKHGNYRVATKVPKKWRGNANIHKAIINHFKAETTSKWVRWLGHFHLDFI